MKRRQEIWKSIPGFPGYLASNDGRIFSPRIMPGKMPFGGNTGRIGIILRPGRYNRSGHLKVILYRDHRRVSMFVHRLVLMAFRGMPKKWNVTRHLDGCPANNRIENLRWGTQKQNVKDKLDH